METVLRYLLEVSFGVGLFFLGYILFFRRSTFFKLNRAYLVAGLVLSFVIPLVTLPEPLVRTTGAHIVSQLATINTPYAPLLHATEESNPVVSTLNVIIVIYITGVVLLLVRAGIGIRSVFKLIKKSSVVQIADTKVYVNNFYPTFSFFNLIFVSHDDIDPLVISHEKIHLQQRHWLDLAIAEIVSIVLWFNPAMIFYKRAIRSQHEFLADEGSIKNSDGLEDYLQCLVAHVHRASRIPASSQFSSQSIKTRIVMMTKTKTSRYYNLVYLCLIPATAFLMLAFQEGPKVLPGEKVVKIIFAVQNTPTDMPVDINKVKIVFPFGEKYNPITTRMQNHTGTDFVMNAGENVMATADGFVLEAGFDEVKGNYVVIQHGDQFITQYFHLQKILVKKDCGVLKGAVIGFVGNTGLSIRNHLHYEVLKNRKAVNAKDYLPKDSKEGC
jgi:murein DD-endopeptidase MepM/ murein hydrolase activator NlpD